MHVYFSNGTLGRFSGRAKPFIPIDLPPRAPTVLRCRLNAEAAEKVSFKLPQSDAPLPGDVACRYIEVKADKGHPEGDKYGHIASSAILMCPESAEKLPLILWPHGGPHSAVMSTFMSQVG